MAGFCLKFQSGRRAAAKLRKGREMSDKTKAALHGRQCSSTENKEHSQNTRAFAGGQNQLFGSIPRCCSSLRNIRLIHVARDESPSLRISSSSCARNSSLKRIWYCGDFFNSCIDMCNYPDYHLSVITRVITFDLKSNAPDCSSSAEASNHDPTRE